ncbi:MBL fold metallo-hydrolase [Mycobacterium asiaticum]|uniref:MBL fold metallo-hydrolase n=1 Tax=Mycobacterium asiaticum TaxID=1790 RepID=A0A1A3MUS9_MYCAS|nr:MBL fold metallo-hydrolase [Mycobacterium asiaticum]OBK12830.1 MBL fold metallo-hydrolase [Mycobacterium asiaticum]
MHQQWDRLADGVHRCRLPFCDVTIGLVWGPSGALLVDTGTTLEEASAIASDVRQIAGRSISHVVLTHQHFDHVLGSSVFAGAEVYCAPDVVQYLASATDQLRKDAVGHGAEPDQVDRAIAALRPPQHGVHDAVVDLGDRTVSVTYLGPGHTRSDLVVVVPAVRTGEPLVLFTGDLVEESADPAIDDDSDIGAWPSTLDRLLSLGGSDAIYVPGHGHVVDAEFIRRQQSWLRARVVENAASPPDGRFSPGSQTGPVQ